MPDTKAHSRVGVFLSYAHEDNDILQAVHRAFEVIRQQTHHQLEIFYDKKSTDELSSNRDIYMERVRTNVDNDPLTRFFNSVADKVEEGFPKDIAYDGTMSKERLERFQAVQKIVPILRGEMYDCLSSREARR